VGNDTATEADRRTIDGWAAYISAHPDISEIILSGGDPFVADDEIFAYALKSLAGLPRITVLRIGTRAVVSDPERVSEPKLTVIRGLDQPVYVGINFEHPDELTPECIAATRRLREANAILYSQTVFLNGVNDDYETLRTLFTRLVEIGVRPYYIYRCDAVPGSSRFRAEFHREREIMTRLRRDLSGLACPTYVIDTPHGSGKIPVPLDFWDFDDSRYRDFEGDEHEPI
jgi:lysine 2,3-aminomutase